MTVWYFLVLHINVFIYLEAESERFSIGFLEGPFKIGAPFQIPLEFHDAFGNVTKQPGKYKPELSARFDTFKEYIIFRLK